MERINRRKFLKTTGKLTLAGTAALTMGPAISNLIPDPLRKAFASETQAEFDVYNGINPSAKDIVAYTFKECLAKKWWPGICYKTSKPMVAVASGTVTDLFRPEDTTGHYFENIRSEQNQAKGFCVRVTTGNCYTLYYLHLQTPEVKVGLKIKRGQIIGYPDEKWNMPRLVINEIGDQIDPNNYGLNHSFMNYWDGTTDLDIGKEEQNKRYEKQKQILNTIGGMVEGPEKYTLFRKKHNGMFLSKWSPIEKFRYVEYLKKNKPQIFPSLTEEQFGEMKKEFYINQPIVLTLPFKKG
jgi:hypothetical protein